MDIVLYIDIPCAANSHITHIKMWKSFSSSIKWTIFMCKWFGWLNIYYHRKVLEWERNYLFSCFARKMQVCYICCGEGGEATNKTYFWIVCTQWYFIVVSFFLFKHYTFNFQVTENVLYQIFMWTHLLRMDWIGYIIPIDTNIRECKKIENRKLYENKKSNKNRTEKKRKEYT